MELSSRRFISSLFSDIHLFTLLYLIYSNLGKVDLMSIKKNHYYKKAIIHFEKLKV